MTDQRPDVEMVDGKGTTAGDPYAAKLIKSALLYASFGWKVIPCYEPIKENGEYICSCLAGDYKDPVSHSIGKHPYFDAKLLPHGLTNATTDPDTIRAWWRKWPRANIAVIGGRASNLVIVDFDFPKGGEESLRTLEQHHGPFPSTAIVHTGNGLHVYFQHPGGGRIPSGTGILGDGVDIRADGGYAVLPPSFHPRGLEYHWRTPPTKPSDIPEMPEWLTKFFERREQEREEVIEANRTHHASGTRRSGNIGIDDKKRRCQAYVNTKPGVAEGGRNEAAAKSVCPIGLDFDLDEDEFWPILQSWNARNSPPLSERELRRTLFSANRSRSYPRGCKLDQDSDEWLAKQAARKASMDAENARWEQTLADAEREAQLGRPTQLTRPRAPGPEIPPPWPDDLYDDEAHGGGGYGGGGRGGGGSHGGGDDGDGPGSDGAPDPDGSGEPSGDLRSKSLMDLESSGSLLGPDKLPRTEIGNSQRILRDHGANIRYVHRTKRWYLWTTSKWTEDVRGEILGELVSKTMRSMHRLMPAAMRVDEETAKAWRTWIKTSESRRCMENSLAIAGSFSSIGLMPEDFDQHDLLVNTPSGVVDIRDLSSGPPDRKLLMSKVTKIGYDPTKDCPAWKAFLLRIFDGDEELITFIQRAAGYSLTGSTREQCLFFCFGTGKNGKSTFITAMQEVAHEYSRAADFGTFLESHGSDSASNDLARLQGARLVAATEPDRAKRLDEATIKRVTGQDVITARFLYSEFFDFKWSAKIWLAANHKPQITGTDEGIWRRIRLIPFTVQISEAEKDPDLPDKLRSEYPGILAWILEGARQWYEHGLGMPAAVEKATETYRTEMDRLADFLRLNCVLNPEATAQSKKVYDLYRAWSFENGEKHVLSHRKFTQALAERNIVTKPTSKFNVYVGLGLLSEHADDDDDAFDGPTQRSFDDD